MNGWLLALTGCLPAPGVAVVDGFPVSQPEGPLAWVDTGATDDPTPGFYEMDGFSFIDDHVAGLPQPGTRAPLADDLEFLVGEGVTLLVSLTLTPTAPDAVADAGMDFLHLPIEDFHPPSLQQQEELVQVLSDRARNGERSAIHCTAGLGRTGTMLATWLVGQGLGAEAAILEVRDARPGSIETADQEQSIHTFEESLP